MEGCLTLLISLIDINTRLCQDIGQRNLTATEGRPDQRRGPGLILHIDIESLVVVQETVKYVGLVALARHVHRIDA